jgi:hypothetical protein
VPRAGQARGDGGSHGRGGDSATPERLLSVATVAANRHAAIWFPDVLASGETWLLLFTKVDGALVMYVGPMTVVAGWGAVGAAVAAPAVETGAAIAIALSALATTKRRVRRDFMSNLSFTLR